MFLRFPKRFFTSSSRPSLKQSSGKPIFMPFISPESLSSRLSCFLSSEVASFLSFEQFISKIAAQSAHHVLWVQFDQAKRHKQ
jgi:hypothetical protein